MARGWCIGAPRIWAPSHPIATIGSSALAPAPTCPLPRHGSGSSESER
jgi:hypothetical protein